MRTRILILNTGGTISSLKTKRGYVPAAGYVEAALKQFTLLKHPDLPDYVIKEYQPLLDSSNMGLSDWNRIAEDIASAYEQFDGFIVFHGTDTMAYTASALSFMLENLRKPVILTGSQIPLSAVRNDAIDNIVTALWLCKHQAIPEVCIYFNQCLLRGNRAQKIDAQGFNAFDSPNYPHLAVIGIDIQIQKHLLLKPGKAPFRLQKLKPQRIANFRLVPGVDLDVLAFLLEQPLKALIVETYGTGNAPNQDKTLLKHLRQACKDGVIIVNRTQCQIGMVEMSQYETGHTLKEAGLVSAKNMTAEAVHCKLLYLLSKDLDLAEVKHLIPRNLCGELGLA